MNQTENINITSTHTPTAAKPTLSTSDIITLVVGIVGIAIALVAVALQIWECYGRRMKVNILNKSHRIL
jgi:hypothetical protein